LIKSVDIIGKAKGFERANNNETARQVWAVSSVYKKLNYADKVFNLHGPKRWEPWLDKIQNLVTIQRFASFPNAEVIPTNKLIKMFGPIFHSSISWMVGYAVLLGYKDIGFHGIHMQHETEYGKQRDSLFYLFGMLHCKKIKLRIDKDSGIYLDTKLYGGF